MYVVLRLPALLGGLQPCCLELKRLVMQLMMTQHIGKVAIIV
jgi:hypothetical protein